MGFGISAMHYVGMSAVHLAGPTYQEPGFVVASIIVSIAASAFALLTLGSRPNRLRLFAGAVVLGLAISGMHYTAMAGMRLDPLCFDVSRFVGAELALSRNTLALLATVISFGVSGAFLLSLVPDSQPRTPRLMMGPEALAAGPAIPIGVARHRIRRGACACDAPRRIFSSHEYPGREGRSGALPRRRRHLRRSRQCALHLHPRRREGIFLQSLDQRVGSGASTRRISRASIAATSSGSRGFRASANRAKPRSRSLANPCAAPSRSRGANIARSRRVSRRCNADSDPSVREKRQPG